MPTPFSSAVLENAFDAIVFDFDGVILESAGIKTDAFRRLFAEHTDDIDRIVAYHEAHAGISRYEKFEAIYAEILHRPLAEAEKRELGIRFEQQAFDAVLRCPMVAGAMEVLEQLSGRIPMLVASGTPEPELARIVRLRHLERFFHGVYGSPRRKEVIIAAAALRQGWNEARMIMVGDAMTDYEAARARGLGFVGRVPVGQESPFPAGTCIIGDLGELLGVLSKMASPAAANEGTSR